MSEAVQQDWFTQNAPKSGGADWFTQNAPPETASHISPQMHSVAQDFISKHPEYANEAQEIIEHGGDEGPGVLHELGGILASPVTSLINAPGAIRNWIAGKISPTGGFSTENPVHLAYGNAIASLFPTAEETFPAGSKDIPAGAMVRAVKTPPEATTTAAAKASPAVDPLLSSAVGIISPRVAYALRTGGRVADLIRRNPGLAPPEIIEFRSTGARTPLWQNIPAAEAEASPAETPSTPASLVSGRKVGGIQNIQEAAPSTNVTPEGLAKLDGKDFSKLSEAQKQDYKTLASANNNFRVEQAAAEAHKAAVQANPPTPRVTVTEPGPPPQSIAEDVRNYVQANKVTPTPVVPIRAPAPIPETIAPAFIQPATGVRPSPSAGTPLRPPVTIQAPAPAPVPPPAPTPEPPPPPPVAKPTPEEMAAPFKSNEQEVAAFNARRELSGAIRHMANRENIVEEMAQKIDDGTMNDEELQHFIKLDPVTKKLIAKRVNMGNLAERMKAESESK